MHSNEYKEKVFKRKVFGTFLVVSTICGIIYYLFYFSVKFGWKVSYEWLWIWLFSLVVDVLLYENSMALIQATLYTIDKKWALRVRNIRKMKYAEFQE